LSLCDEQAIGVAVDSGGLQRAVGVLVNGVHCAHSPEGLETVLHAGDEIAVFPPMAGG